MQITNNTAVASLESLQRARTLSQKLPILRAIKNSLTGHELRKIEYVHAGILPCLLDLVTTLDKASESSERDDCQDQERDTLWLQTASIIAVIANAGTAFAKPVLRSGLVALLLVQLSITTIAKLRLIILRSLNAVASNLPLQSEKEWVADQSLAKCLYTRTNLECIVKIVADTTTNTLAQQIREAALGLICKTCGNERQKNLLVEVGLLHVLCSQLSRSVVIDHFHDNNTLGQARSTGQSSRLPNRISPLLETIGLLIEKSKRYAEIFVNSEEILSALSVAMDSVYTQALFLQNPDCVSTGQILRMPPSENLPTKIDVLLPEVMDLEGMRAARRSNFPPLDGINQCIRRRGNTSRTSANQSFDSLTNAGNSVYTETLVVPWLLYIARSSSKRRRTIAARVLAILKCHGFLQSSRVRSLAALLVPILVDMLDGIDEDELCTMYDMRSDSLFGCPYQYFAPSTLALIARDQECLQKAAVDCKVIPKLSAALKANTEKPCEAIPNLWWPHRLQDKLTDGELDSCLGRGGPSQHLRMTMRLREGLLQALAAISPDNDNYRKEICDQGALTSIMLALEPFRSQVTHNKDVDRLSSQGNSPEVIVAACGAVRALSRSPTTLRTKLVDADVAKAILKLLYTNDPEVRISATMVLANLSHDFSPMKQSVSEANVVRKLCEQAHSANARLRLESLFTLKALVTNSPNKLRKLIVDELGCSWIRYLVATDPHDVPHGEVIGLVQKDHRKGSMARFNNSEKDHVMEDAETSKKEFEEPETEAYNKHSLQQDLDIQAEILAFLRNLTTGESTIEIIDYLFTEIGQEDLLQAIMDRLRDKIQSSPHVVGQIRRTPLVPAATVINTLYVVAHFAASDRRYRMMLCNNTPLMRQISVLFNSDDASIRSACCWVVINLIYPSTVGSGIGNSSVGDSIDVVMARAKELQRLGIRNVVRRLEKTEQVVDVRERAATAAECFGKLLDRG